MTQFSGLGMFLLAIIIPWSHAASAELSKMLMMSFGKNITGVLFPLIAKELKCVRNFGKCSLQHQVQEAIQLKEYPATAEWENADPYEAIPGPKPLPIPKGNIWRFLPYGNYYKLDPDQLHEKLFKEFGQIVRLTGINHQDFIILYSAKDTETMFRNESTMPIRKGLYCLEYYRNVLRRDWFGGHPGLLTTEGEEWYQFRKIVNQPMVQPRSAKMYVQPVGKVADCFIERMKRLRDSKLEMPDDFLHELEKWALESIGVIALDARFGCLDDNLPPDSEAINIVKLVKEMFHSFYILEMKMSPWRYVWTPAYGKFVKTMDSLCLIARRHINKKWEELQKKDPNEEGNPSVLQNILLRSEDTNVAFTMATDMILAGVDTTSSILANVLYFLAKNPDKQEKLYKELRELMPTKDHDLTDHDLNEAKYLKACIKETHRISPITVGTQRVMVKDVVLSNYQVPKGTWVVCHNMIMCRQEKYFKRPDDYIPERWLKTKESSKLAADEMNPFVFLPFGFGPRMCIGRRFAELEMQILASKIIRNFKISYPYGEMTWSAKLLRSPKKPLKLKMEDRDD